MITLGQASNYSAGQVGRQLFALGTQKDSERLQEALAERYRVPTQNVSLYHTGRSALAAALKAVAPEGKKNVIIPGLTCIAVVRAVKAAGCRPIFVDIRRENLEYDYQKLEQTLAKLERDTKDSDIKDIAISKKALDNSDTVCYNGSIVLVQNTLGISWDVSKIEKLASKYHALIVEDLAHCAGRFYADGREVGTVGAAAALSFGKGKAIDTISGGALIVRDGVMQDLPTKKPKISDRLRDRWYPLFGSVARGLWSCGIGKVLIGGLVKIHLVQRSADAELNLEHRLTHWQAKLALKQLRNLPQTPMRDYKLVRKRSEVLQKFQQNGYCLDEIWYDTPVSPARYAKEVDFPSRDCPETVKIAQEIINFPTWYAPEKLERAYEIAKEYEIEE